jgi:hypothetical protein
MLWALLSLALWSQSSVLLKADGISLPTNSYTGRLDLGFWGFSDTNTWVSDFGATPISFTNLAVYDSGYGNTAVVVDSADPAWLQYNIFEPSGTQTNLQVDLGSLSIWFRPNWSSVSEGGSGPGCWGRIIEIGNYTQDNSSSWWSLFMDPDGANIYFATQTNGQPAMTNLVLPIDCTNGGWHMLALTYSSTNAMLIWDGVSVTNGLPLSYWPSADVLSNGFLIGSDSNGVLQAHGALDNLNTSNFERDSNTIWLTYLTLATITYGGPTYIAELASAPSVTSNTMGYQAISGSGFLTNTGAASTCINSTNVWFTNITAFATNGAMAIAFDICGGSNGWPYDVFANAVVGPTNSQAYKWYWMGQGYTCNRYQLSSLTNSTVFLRLGTPLDSDHDGLTDAYELLVSHTDPHNPDTDGDGISDSDEVLLKMNPLVADPPFPTTTTIQTCPQ